MCRETINSCRRRRPRLVHFVINLAFLLQNTKYRLFIHPSIMSGVFLVAAKRTPFGSFGGSLKGFSATQLGVASTQAALESIQLDPTAVDACFVGNVIQSSPDAAYLARHVALQSGMKQSTPSLTINRLCGSGFETVVLGAHSIRLGEAHIVACGGTENMSDAPLTVRGNDARWGVKLGTGLRMGDALWDGLTDGHAGTPMGVTAENLAKKYGITREVSTFFCAKNIIFLYIYARLDICLTCHSPLSFVMSHFYIDNRNAMLLPCAVNRSGPRPRQMGCLMPKSLPWKSRLEKVPNV